MINLFKKNNLKSAGEESILINLFQNGFFLLNEKNGLARYFLIKLYLKATKEAA